MLGAELGELDSLATRMSAVTGNIGSAQTNTNSATTNVVSSVTSSAATARSAIDAALGELRSAVSGAVVQANGTNWTGANSTVFKGAAADFDSAMAAAEAATAETFALFETNISQMSQALADYQQSFSTALTNAQTSTTSMQNAVQQQRAQLDSTMNTGMSVG